MRIIRRRIRCETECVFLLRTVEQKRQDRGKRKNEKRKKESRFDISVHNEEEMSITTINISSHWSLSNGPYLLITLVFFPSLILCTDCTAMSNPWIICPGIHPNPLIWL